MKMNYRFLIPVFLVLVNFFGCKSASAQELLTLEDAVKIALERNYDIRLFSNDLRIDKNNVTLGNAGLLPVATGTLNNNNAIQNSTQTLSNGTTQERNGARNSNLNYGVGLSWTVFDGFGMFARYDQLQELQKLGEADLQTTILARVGDVMERYYAMVQQQQQLKANQTAIEISRLRLVTAQNRFQIGKAARLEVLNAQVDYNTDTTNYLRQLELYHTQKVQLNELLARDVNTDFRVADTVEIDSKLTLPELTDLVAQQNPSLKAAKINKRVAELDLKQVRANRYPSISLNSGYNFSRSESALGFATQSSGRGLNYGVSASVNLFNGFNQRRNEKNAAIAIESSQLQIEQLNLNLNAQLSNSYKVYQTNLALVNLEEKNQRSAQQNLDITMEKFRLGSLTPVEFREAQLNYVNASVRYSNAQYLAKLAEISLKELAGNITL